MHGHYSTKRSRPPAIKGLSERSRRDLSDKLSTASWLALLAKFYTIPHSADQVSGKRFGALNLAHFSPVALSDDPCAIVSVLLWFRLNQGFNMSYQWPAGSNLRPKNTGKSEKRCESHPGKRSGAEFRTYVDCKLVWRPLRHCFSVPTVQARSGLQFELSMAV